MLLADQPFVTEDHRLEDLCKLLAQGRKYLYNNIQMPEVYKKSRL